MYGPTHLLLAVLITGVLSLVVVACFRNNGGARRKEAAEQQRLEAILSCIAERQGAEFDFASAAGRLGLRRGQLSRQLLELERAGRIRVTPKDPRRKPILITPADQTAYFWKVSLTPQTNENE